MSARVWVASATCGGVLLGYGGWRLAGLLSDGVTFAIAAGFLVWLGVSVGILCGLLLTSMLSPAPDPAPAVAPPPSLVLHDDPEAMWREIRRW